MEPFSRPEDEMREYQALLGQLEDYCKNLKQDIEDTRVLLAKNEEILAALLESQTGDKYQQELGQEIQDLLTRWKEYRETLDQDPTNELARQELKYIGDSLSFSANQKLQDKIVSNDQIKFIKSDILSVSKHLKLAEGYLADWERDKEKILKDIDLLREEVERFNRMYQSKN